MSNAPAVMDAVELVYIKNLHPKPGQFRESGWRWSEEVRETMRLERWLDSMSFVLLKILLKRGRR